MILKIFTIEFDKHFVLSLSWRRSTAWDHDFYVWSGHTYHVKWLLSTDISRLFTVHVHTFSNIETKRIVSYRNQLTYLSKLQSGRGRIPSATTPSRFIRFGNYIINVSSEIKTQYFIVRHKTNRYLSAYLRQQNRRQLRQDKCHRRWTFNQHRYSSKLCLVILSLYRWSVWVACVYTRALIEQIY